MYYYNINVHCTAVQHCDCLHCQVLLLPLLFHFVVVVLLLLHFVINIMLLFHWTFLFVVHGALLHSIDLSVENFLATVCHAIINPHREIAFTTECCLHCLQVWNCNVWNNLESSATWLYFNFVLTHANEKWKTKSIWAIFSPKM